MQMHRRPLLPNDVLIKMKFCGVCHSDLHSAAGMIIVLIITNFMGEKVFFITHTHTSHHTTTYLIRINDSTLKKIHTLLI